MSDELRVLLTFAAIPIGAVLFVLALRREDDARRTRGWTLWHAGYASRAGAIAIVALCVGVALLLLRG